CPYRSGLGGLGYQMALSLKISVFSLIFAAACAPPPAAANVAADAGADAANFAGEVAYTAETTPVYDATAVDAATDATAKPDTTATPDATATFTTVIVHYPQAKQLHLRGNTPPLSWDSDLEPVAVQADTATFQLPPAKGPIQVKVRQNSLWALGNNHLVQPKT